MAEETKPQSVGENKNGLSLEEQKWLGNWFLAIRKSQEQQTEILGKINGSLTFIVVIIIIGIVLTLLRGCIGA